MAAAVRPTRTDGWPGPTCPWLHFQHMTDNDVSTWTPMFLQLDQASLLNFMMYGNSKEGSQGAVASEPSMLGAAVRFTSVNTRSFDLTMSLMQRLDDESRKLLMSATDGHGSTALMDACTASPSSIALVKALLAAGGRSVVNSTDVAGRTALMLAASRGFSDAVRELIERAGDVEQRDSSGRTALQHACGARASRAVAVLLASDATVDAQTLWRCAPLFTTSALSYVRWHACVVALAMGIIGMWMLAKKTLARQEGGHDDVGGALSKRSFLQRLRDVCPPWLLRRLCGRFDDADGLAGELEETDRPPEKTEAGRPGTRGHRPGHYKSRRRAAGAATTRVQSALAGTRWLRAVVARAVPQGPGQGWAPTVLTPLSRMVGRWLRETWGTLADSFAGSHLADILAIAAMVSASTWSYARSTVHDLSTGSGSETVLVWQQMILYIGTVVVTASWFPDVRGDDLTPEIAAAGERRQESRITTTHTGQASSRHSPADRSLFVQWSRLVAVAYIALHWFLYRYCRLLPLQTVDALSELLTGRAAFRLSSWIRCCASVHISVWMVLPWPFVLGGLQLTERLRSNFPPWKAFRWATSLIGLNDLLLCVCFCAFLGVTSAGGHNPLQGAIAQQLYLMHARSLAHAVTQLACASLFTPANRLWLAGRREALVGVMQSTAVRALAEGVRNGEPSPEKSPPATQLECVVCMDDAATCILAPCGHMCVCGSCGDDLSRTNALCPLCRQPVESTVTRVYS